MLLNLGNVKTVRILARQILEPFKTFERLRWGHQGNFILNGEPIPSTGQNGRYI